MRTRTVEASSGEVVLREWGAPARETVLFWHGSGGDGYEAAPLARKLKARVVAPDAPGHGGSAPLRPEEYLPSRLAALAVELLDALDVDRVVAVGFSWGASVVCRLAAAFPHRVRAVVLVEGGHLDFADLPGFDGEASLEERVREHGLGGALAHGLVVEPNVETYPFLAERRAGGPRDLVLARGGRVAGAEPALALSPRRPAARGRARLRRRARPRRRRPRGRGRGDGALPRGAYYY